MKVKYKNWSINKKLLSISLSAFLPMVILAAYLIVSLNNAASAYSEITKSIAYANRYVKDFKSRLDVLKIHCLHSVFVYRIWINRLKNGLLMMREWNILTVMSKI